MQECVCVCGWRTSFACPLHMFRLYGIWPSCPAGCAIKIPCLRPRTCRDLMLWIALTTNLCLDKFVVQKMCCVTLSTGTHHHVEHWVLTATVTACSTLSPRESMQCVYNNDTLCEIEWTSNSDVATHENNILLNILQPQYVAMFPFTYTCS